jgi:hypothetical protein
MTPENMTMDELVLIGSQSIDPILLEMCKRLHGRRLGPQEETHTAQVAGRTMRSIKEDGNMILLIFTDGSYLVIEAEVFNDDVGFSMGRKLLRSELYYHNLMSPAETQIYRDEQAALETERKAKRLEQLRKELAELEK